MKTILTVFFSVFSLVLFAQVPTENLRVFYPFNGNASDETGNGFDGVVDGATLTSDRFGNQNSAYLFNGSTDHIEVQQFSAIDTTSELTISLWAKATANTSNCMLMLYPDDNSDRCVTCAQFFGSIYWDYGSIYSNGRMTVSSIPFDTLWHHYVYSISFDESVKQVYMDGELLKSDTGSIGSGITDKERSLWIGGGTDANPGDIGFHGAIDDIRIYNKFLTQNDIKFLNYESPCSIQVFDTTNVIVYDTLVVNDTLTIYDTLVVNDIVTVYDTLVVNDTLQVYDTLFVYDTLIVNDTLFVYDTVSVSVADTLIINFVIAGLEDTYEIKAYPIPTDDVLNISFSDYEISAGYSVKIMNSSGTVLYEELVNDKDLKINLTSLGSKGIYFLYIIDNKKNQVAVKKIILK